MVEKIHLLVPMSGQGTRYRLAGYKQPKPLIPVNGTPMIERLLSNFPADWPARFVLAQNQKEKELDIFLRCLRADAQIDFIPPHSFGPSYAILDSLKDMPSEAPVLVSYCDYGMVWDARQFERFVSDSDCDACVISYRGFHAHYNSPLKYAYCRMNGERVVEIREKGSFTEDRTSEFASVGAYYFRSVKLLREAIQFQIQNSLCLNGEYYTSLTVEALLQMKPNAHVRVFEIPGFFQWGTPDSLRSFEYWERTYRAFSKNIGSQLSVSQVLLPMAGMGSRFREISPLPKPLIPVFGSPMFEAAIRTLPRAPKTVLVCLESMMSEIRLSSKINVDLISIQNTPNGQALSTEFGLSGINLAEELIVSSCDHGIVLSEKNWNDLRADPGADAAIFTISEFPGVESSPNSYAYVVPKGDSNIPEVFRVSVKKPVSSQPGHDHVLVGTFWFREAKTLAKGISELKKLDLKVNGELYLDSIFELLMKMKCTIRMVPLDGYLCWGTPESLCEALYWQEQFLGQRIESRSRFPGTQVKELTGD